MAQLWIQADFLQHFYHALFPLLCAKSLVHFQPFGDDLLHVQARVQGGVGILEDDLHPAAVGQHLLHRERVQRFAVEPDGAL